MDSVRIDISNIEGTYCYCCRNSFAAIRETVSGSPLEAVHLLGTGDYHYLTLFELERIREPFALVLFDNHSDDINGTFDRDELSCGNWVQKARESLPLLKCDTWINGRDGAAAILDGLPVYLSVDLDVLGRGYASTDWDQGTMTTAGLSEAISAVLSGHRLIGADICGGMKYPSARDTALNDSVIRQISKQISPEP